ncbi:MAG: hypothetical protein KGO93_01335 [Cyanobacteria bacterium REEB446]|nr:hypothetical protein [Cyanobacteria bacterium REEB446]
MLDAIKGFFSLIPGLGKQEAPAPSRQPTRLSSSHSRSALQGISQAVSTSQPENISLPISPEDLRNVLKDITKYITQVTQNPLKLGEKISSKICVIAEKMTQVSAAVAKQMGLSPEQLIALGAKFKKGIGPWGLRECKEDLAKLIRFYVGAFNMEKEATSLASFL